MNERIALIGLVEILSSLSCGIVILFITYRLVRVYGRKRLMIDEKNTAYNILLGSVLFSVGYIVSGVLQPIIDSYRILSNTDISQAKLVVNFILYGGLYIAIAYIFAMVICLVGIKIYSAMTPMNEAEEIQNNNIGVAVTVSAIVITLSMMSSDGVGLVIESFIPYPDLPNTVGL